MAYEIYLVKPETNHWRYVGETSSGADQEGMERLLETTGMERYQDEVFETICTDEIE